MKTLVVILGETRAAELTYENFKKNVVDELDADVCVCIGVDFNYDCENPTRWAKGTYSEEHGYFIKYPNEYRTSTKYKTDFENSGLTLQDFYGNHINKKSI